MFRYADADWQTLCRTVSLRSPSAFLFLLDQSIDHFLVLHRPDLDLEEDWMLWPRLTQHVLLRLDNGLVLFLESKLAQVAETVPSVLRNSTMGWSRPAF